MQNAKDTFYEVMRGRLAVLNPERTITVRGVSRPGVLVDENELQSTAAMTDCFHMEWTAAEGEGDGALPLVVLTCSFLYSTAGSGMNGGLDRGRMLAAMDGELLAAVGQVPQNAVKSNYSALANGGAVAGMTTRIWWSRVRFGQVTAERERMTRVASVTVLSYQEAGEL